MRQNRRRKNRQNTGRARRCWKGMLAVIAAAATFLTGIDVTGLQTVFANGRSGYRIEVSYSEDRSSAILSGNADSLAQGVSLVSVTDAEGREYSPSEFSYPVTENGDYTFTVDYNVEDGETVREEEEELTVTADGIEKPVTDEETAGKEEALTVSADEAEKTGTEEDGPAGSAGTPQRMAVSELLTRAQSTEDQIQPLSIPAYTAESNLRLGTAAISYLGGKFSEELTGELSGYPGRVFDYAYFVFPGDDTEFPLLGLYPLYDAGTQTTDWYYILEDKDNTGSAGDQDSDTDSIDAQAAVALPENAEIRAKYKVTATPFTITQKYIKPEGTTDTNQESIKRWNTSLVNQGRATEQIVVTFTLPVEYTSAVVEVAGADGVPFKTFDTANAASTGLQENVGGIDNRYSGVFEMKSGSVTVTFKAKVDGEGGFQKFGVAWPRSENRDGGNRQIEAGRTYASVNTDSKGKPEYKISYISDRGESNTKTFSWVDPNYRGGGIQQVPLYNSSDVISNRRTMQGQYKKGETQTIQIQYEMGSLSNPRYTYIPTVLDFYVYKGVSLGTNPSNSGVILEQIALPQTKNETITYPLETGGTVNVTLTEKKNRTIDEQTPDGDLGYHTVFGQRYPNDKNDEVSYQNVAHPYWVYEIKVSGTRYPYVVSMLDDSGAQETFIIKEMNGVETGQTKAGGATDTEYSTYFENRNGSGRKEYPLNMGSIMWQKYMADTHPSTKRSATMLHLVPKMGYGWPRVTLKNDAPGQQAGRDTTPGKTPGGKTYYTHYISSASSGGKYRDTVTSIEITAEPIALNVKYSSGSGENDPSSGAVSLKPASDGYYSVILQNGLVPDGQYMNGYTLTIKNSAGGVITVNNPEHSSNKWYPGDIINVQDLYWEMASATSGGNPFLQQGQGTAPNTYTMTFTASISNTPTTGSYGNVEYKIRTQNSYSPWTGDPSSADHETMYSDDNGFTSRTGSVMAYIGSQVLLRNYPDMIEGPPNLILSEYSLTAVEKAEAQSTLDLVYLAGVQVEFTGLQSGHSSTLVEMSGGSGKYTYAEETWFTGMDKHGNVIDLDSINPGNAPQDKVFAGWKITNTGGDSYNGGNPVTGELNLHTVGKEASDLWNQIFLTDGVIKLEAQWKDAMERITLPDGAMSGSKDVKLYQSPYTISATFNMASSVSAGNTVDYAIYISRPNNLGWGIADLGRVDLSRENDSVIRAAIPGGNRFFDNLQNATVSADVQTSGNSTDITLTVSNFTDLTGNQKVYRIYMWNSQNGNANLWSGGSAGGAINTAYRSELSAFTPVENYPYMDLTLHQIPKVLPETDTVMESEKDMLFYEGQAFTVTGTFNLESGKDTYDEIHRDNANTEIKAALYKVNPPDDEGNYGDYAIWATNEGAVQSHLNKVSAPTIQKVSDTKFTVSYTILDNSGSIANIWDDGAKYRVFAWTNSNGGVTGNSDFGQEGDAFPVNDNITTIPSTTTTMAGVLGQQVESIIHYPKQITMLDNVRPDNKNIFSGNEKITIQPILDNGNKAEIPNPDVGVDVVIQELNGKSTFDISRGSVNIPLKGFIGTIGNGVAIPDTGKLGTLKFDPDNNSTQDLLEFYFRSENPPTVADGSAFEGTIHFQFSNGSGTTN